MDGPICLTDEIVGLHDHDTDALRARWRELHGCEPVARLSRDLLIRAISHRLQERACGGPSKKARRALARHTRSLEQTGAIAQPREPGIKTGTNLIREWNGRVHQIEVTNDGYVWDGERHGSLSAIARAITGTRWSGPRFFGLHERTVGQGTSAPPSEMADG